MSSAGCFIGALVARTSDYVPLCIYTDENYNSTNNVFRQQAQRILERMETPAGGANRAEARGSYYQSYNHKDSIYFAFQDAATNLTIIAALNKLLLRNSGDLNGINRLGCGLLDAIFAEFTQNNDPNEYLAESVRPFQFQKFDGVIQRCMSKVHQAGDERRKCGWWQPPTGQSELRRVEARINGCASCDA
ncbi:vesicle transport protein SEC22 [Angomonas deanei]|nr:vesicle transport protein SEC22 [Angomonas deanei]|eukprot:EPY34026.1 vesicle transport protein SEC22 [Angomonas deanei]